MNKKCLGSDIVIKKDEAIPMITNCSLEHFAIFVSAPGTNASEIGHTVIREV